MAKIKKNGYPGNIINLLILFRETDFAFCNFVTSSR